MLCFLLFSCSFSCLPSKALVSVLILWWRHLLRRSSATQMHWPWKTFSVSSRCTRPWTMIWNTTDNRKSYLSIYLSMVSIHLSTSVCLSVCYFILLYIVFNNTILFLFVFHLHCSFVDGVTQALCSYLPKISTFELLRSVYYLSVLGCFPSAPLQQLMNEDTMNQFKSTGEGSQPIYLIFILNLPECCSYV